MNLPEIQDMQAEPIEVEKTNLIVNFVPQAMTDKEIYTLFSTFGDIESCRLIKNQLTSNFYFFVILLSYTVCFLWNNAEKFQKSLKFPLSMWLEDHDQQICSPENRRICKNP